MQRYKFSMRVKYEDIIYYFIQQNGGRWYTRSFVQDMIKRKVKRKLLKAQIKDLRSEFKEQIKSKVTEEK